MQKFICQQCREACYGWAKSNICPICGGILAKIVKDKGNKAEKKAYSNISEENISNNYYKIDGYYVDEKREKVNKE